MNSTHAGADVPRAESGRPVNEVTVGAVLAGEIGPDDIRISFDGLARQAAVAREHGDNQLAENLLRAAELVAVPEDQLLEYYELLRPGRATPDRLRSVGEELRDRGMPLVAALFTEAAAATPVARDGDA